MNITLETKSGQKYLLKSEELVEQFSDFCDTEKYSVDSTFMASVLTNFLSTYENEPEIEGKGVDMKRGDRIVIHYGPAGGGGSHSEGKKGCCKMCRGEDIVEGGCISPKFCPCHLEGKPESV